MLNKVMIMGRLTADPEMRKTQSGTSVATFSIASDRDFKDANGARETDFIQCVAWRNTADYVCKYFSKGRMAVVEGRLQSRRYQDRNGSNRTAIEIIVENMYFGDSKREESSNTYQYQAAGRPVDVYPESDFEEVEDDGDLPF